MFTSEYQSNLVRTAERAPLFVSLKYTKLRDNAAETIGDMEADLSVPVECADIDRTNWPAKEKTGSA